jgi:hypothetical protein
MKDFSDSYEACRLYTIRKMLTKMKSGGLNPTTILECVELMQKLPCTLKVWIALLDWHLFRTLPNGANMIVVGRKTS